MLSLAISQSEKSALGIAVGIEFAVNFQTSFGRVAAIRSAIAR